MKPESRRRSRRLSIGIPEWKGAASTPAGVPGPSNHRIEDMRISRRDLILLLIVISAASSGCSRLGSGFGGDVRVGASRAYSVLGEMPVKHRGRAKPFGAAAIDEVRFES